MNIKQLPLGTPDEFNVVIEISKGSKNKYEYDEELDVIKLDRVLYSSQDYPTNYGFIPETRAQDGDHTDALVFSTDPLQSGTVVTCRAIGFMDMNDSGEIDNKILAVPTVDPRFADIKNLEDLPEHTLKEIKNFFETLKVLQNKVVTVAGFSGADRAKQEIIDTAAAYKK